MFPSPKLPEIANQAMRDEHGVAVAEAVERAFGQRQLVYPQTVGRKDTGPVRGRSSG